MPKSTLCPPAHAGRADPRRLRDATDRLTDTLAKTIVAVLLGFAQIEQETRRERQAAGFTEAKIERLKLISITSVVVLTKELPLSPPHRKISLK